mmetsp:Transcript_17815/g.26686  ORF Transcript_17815/g.26686 Transcript_17815/m.26686 type:complete len:275 (-) Transcript_17815:704-1528(-)
MCHFSSQQAQSSNSLMASSSSSFVLDYTSIHLPSSITHHPSSENFISFKMVPMNKLGALIMMFVAVSPLGSILRLSMLLFDTMCPLSDGTGDGDNSTTCYVRELLTTLLSVPPHFNDGNGNGNGIDIHLDNIEIPKGIASYFYSGARRNITTDDIMQTIFHHHAMPINSLYPLNPIWSSSSSSSSRDHLNQDLHMVLPWIFAFTALILVPAAMIVFSALSSRGEMENSYKCRKIKIFEQCLQDFQKEVVAEDINVHSSESKSKHAGKHFVRRKE